MKTPTANREELEIQNQFRPWNVVSSNLELPQFGRNVNVHGIVKFDGEFERSIWDRLNDYRHTCLELNQINEVTPEAYAIWRSRQLKYRNLKEFKRGVGIYYLEQFENLVNQLVEVSAECFRYGIPQKAKRSLEIINVYYLDTSRWRKLILGNRSVMADFDKDFALIRNMLHERLNVLDQYHIEEFKVWVAHHPEKYEIARVKMNNRIDGLCLKQELHDMKINMDRQIADMRNRAEEAEREAKKTRAAAAAAINEAREQVEDAQNRAATAAALAEQERTMAIQRELNAKHGLPY